MPVLQAARISKACNIIFTTNHDLDNLNALVGIREQNLTDRRQSIYCHLGDLGLLDNFKRTLFKEQAYKQVHVFNGYQSATKRLYQTLKPQNLYDPQGTVFILFGYGRFGRMLFSHIVQDDHRDNADEVFIVSEYITSSYDLDRLQFQWTGEKMEKPCLIHNPIIHDMHNPAVWAKLVEQLQGHSKRVLAFVCRDNDTANLDLAISIKLKGPQRLQQATFICRMYAKAIKELNDMLDHRLTPNQSRDVILFPLENDRTFDLSQSAKKEGQLSSPIAISGIKAIH